LFSIGADGARSEPSASYFQTENVRPNECTVSSNDRVQETEDIFNFFLKKCGPPPSDLEPAKIGAIPPGIFRRAVGEERRAFVGVCENGCKKPADH
jgi:hypothetical protein